MNNRLMKMNAYVYLIDILIVTLTFLCADSQGSTLAKWAEDDCRRVLREAIDVSVKSTSPPRLLGHWTSSVCEVRPGPEFVLRKYLFRRNSFQAQVFYYQDEYCTQATHLINARGSVTTARPSWRTSGAYEARFSLKGVSVIPYTHEKAKTFGKYMRRYCKKSDVTSVLPYKKFRILQFTKYSKRKLNKNRNNFIENDFDCTKLFNFTMNELQLVRIEKRKVESVQYRSRKELFLGDISTNMKYRRQYVPTHYQTPLLKSKTQDCKVCRIIVNATHTTPPRLELPGSLEVGISGEWVSQRCETRPNGQYLTRYLSFLRDGKSWQGVYEFYRDPLCSTPSFKLEVKGTYAKGKRSNKLHSAYNYIFKTSRLKVTAMDFQTVSYLNSYYGDQCGDPGTWNIGVTQDVTRTNGCATLGIALPNIEYELIRTEYHDRRSFLFVGQRPSDFVALSTSKNRPTSFQTSLVKCGSKNDVSEEIMPVFEHYAAYSADKGEIHANTGTGIEPSAILVVIETTVYTLYRFASYL